MFQSQGGNPQLSSGPNARATDSAALHRQCGPQIPGRATARQADLPSHAGLLACVTSGGKILACGAGVSGFLAAQFAAQFVGRFERDRPELAAIALLGDATDPAADTAESLGADRFARQVRALGQAGDVLLVLSVSGQSAAVLAAVEAAHARDMTVVALLGNAAPSGSRTGGAVGRALRETDVQVCVPHERAARIHEIHLLVLHCLCDGVDAQLLGDQDSDSSSA